MFKSIFMSISILVLFSVTIACSQERGRRFSLEDQIKNLKENLELTDEQVEKIKPILEKQREQMQEMRDNFDGERSEMREAMTEIREETDKKINEVLTDEQKEKYQEIQEERRSRRRRP
ncbi:MAG: hypothetical protein D8M58_15075 [Calditrichaeota bacterium]|nr:MAG: hypothetical protein DWQ03_16315 [Calditrichota bacterium]MBL1206726.1 hypothetical protein [Calditrichota bacterium]NOG46552.1 hypothetical protein [Calditrichota bacterium]